MNSEPQRRVGYVMGRRALAIALACGVAVAATGFGVSLAAGAAPTAYLLESFGIGFFVFVYLLQEALLRTRATLVEGTFRAYAARLPNLALCLPWWFVEKIEVETTKIEGFRPKLFLGRPARRLWIITFRWEAGSRTTFVLSRVPKEVAQRVRAVVKAKVRPTA